MRGGGNGKGEGSRDQARMQMGTDWTDGDGTEREIDTRLGTDLLMKALPPAAHPSLPGSTAFRGSGRLWFSCLPTHLWSPPPCPPSLSSGPGQ